jgi:hypothetical protein
VAWINADAPNQTVYCLTHGPDLPRFYLRISNGIVYNQPISTGPTGLLVKPKAQTVMGSTAHESFLSFNGLTHSRPSGSLGWSQVQSALWYLWTSCGLDLRGKRGGLKVLSSSKGIYTSSHPSCLFSNLQTATLLFGNLFIPLQPTSIFTIPTKAQHSFPIFINTYPLL